MILEAVDYETRGAGYASVRKTEPRIAAPIHQALGQAGTVVNVGAGTGSYEPGDVSVLAFEPAAAMRAQRPRRLAPAIDASAENLPLDDDSVEAAMAVLSLHHWRDREAGLREMRRVARGAVVILTFDPTIRREYWLLRHYLPEVAEHDQEVFPPPGDVLEILGGGRVEAIAIPADCRDGFLEAYFARPEAFLDPAVRRGQSGWGRLEPGAEDRVAKALALDLDSGAWDEAHGQSRRLRYFDGGLRLVISPGAQDVDGG